MQPCSGKIIYPDWSVVYYSGNLRTILAEINHTARKSTQRNLFLEMFNSKDVRSSLQCSFDQLQSCLSTLQLAFNLTTGVSQ